MASKKLETQQECWAYLCNGNTMYSNNVPIKFIYGRLCAIVKGKWTPCPVIFENPTLFTKEKT